MNAKDIDAASAVYADFIGAHDVVRVKISKARAKRLLNGPAGFDAIDLDEDGAGKRLLIVACAN